MLEKKLRVLLVDDEEGLRRTMRKMLERRGCEVVGEGADGVEGVEAARDTSFDVVLTDLRMPNMDGLEMTRQIKAMAPQVPVVVFSAYADASLQAEGVEAGVAAWVLKGTAAEEVVRALHAAVATPPAQ